MTTITHMPDYPSRMVSAQRNPSFPALKHSSGQIDLPPNIDSEVPSNFDLGTYDRLGRAVGQQDVSSALPQNGYEQFMPTRPGFSSSNLALAVTDPGAEPFSNGKSANTLAAAARTTLDDRYQLMQANGRPYSPDSLEGQDNYSLMGAFDRRALNSIRANAFGLFSNAEQALAASMMSQQQGLATGLYSGPVRLASAFTSHADNYELVGQLGVMWLDKVSADEKSTRTWFMSRTGSQELIDWSRSVEEDGAKSATTPFSLIDILLELDRERSSSQGPDDDNAGNPELAAPSRGFAIYL